MICAVAATLQAAFGIRAVSRLRVFQGAGRADLPERSRGTPAATSVTRRATTPPLEKPRGSRSLDRGTVAPQLRDGLQTGGPRQLRCEPPSVHAARARGGAATPSTTAAGNSKSKDDPDWKTLAQWAKTGRSGQEQVVPRLPKAERHNTGASRQAMPCASSWRDAFHGAPNAPFSSRPDRVSSAHGFPTFPNR